MCRDGIINLLKPAGMTSHDAVQFLRRLTGIKRIGHTGTLDPMAVGVLPLCIGSATRITEYLDLDYKKYRCEMQLGIETDTQDIWGTAVAGITEDLPTTMKKLGITKESAEKALKEFQGMIQQFPPKYSAVRVDGKRLYEYARQGLDVEIKSRQVEIKSIDLVEFDEENGRILFDVECSKGTYIRTICVEVGGKLGMGSAMSFLVRTASGSFTLDQTVTIEELKALKLEDGNLDVAAFDRYIFDIDFPLVHFGKAYASKDRGLWFINGGHLALTDVTITELPKHKEMYNIYTENGDFLGVAAYNHDYHKLVAEKVFVRNNIDKEQSI